MCGFATRCACPQRCERSARNRFRVSGPATLSADSFRRLVNGAFLPIQDLAFLTAEECDQIQKEHQAILAMTPELKQAYPFAEDVVFTAPALHAFADRPEVYFELAAKATEVRREHAPTWDRAVEKVIERLASVHDGAVRIAVQEDRGEAFYAGILRAINHGAEAHTDYVGTDLDVEYAVRAVTRQFGVNVFLSDIKEGGACISWDRFSRPGDVAYRTTTTSYGIDERLFKGTPKVRLSPIRGSMTIIPTQRYHAIRPITDGERVTLSFFFGTLPNGDIIVWA